MGELKPEALADQSDSAANLLMNQRPILDSEMNAVGCELRTHSTVVGGAGPSSPNSLSPANLKSLQENFDVLTGTSWALISVPWSVISSGEYKVLPKERVVIGIEDGPRDERGFQVLSKLFMQGYRLAVRDVKDGVRPETQFASIVRLDLAEVTEQLARPRGALGSHKPKLLVSGIRTHEDFEYCKAIGVELFSGDFFCKPRKALKAVSVNHAAMVQLLAALQNPEVGVRDLEDIIRYDVSLSYKLLRFINSAYVGLNREVSSIKHAIGLAGIARLRKWASLLLFSSVENKPRQLLVTASTRARMCEQLADSDGEERRDAFFTVGLLSVLDALLDCPMAEVVRALPLSHEISEALIHQSGPLGTSLRAAIAYEQSDWQRHALLRFYPARLRAAYLEAVEWTRSVTSGLMIS